MHCPCALEQWILTMLMLQDSRGRGRQRQVISDEIRARLVHHVLIHGRTMKEAGQPVHGCIHCPYFQEGERVICVVTDICNAVVHIA